MSQFVTADDIREGFAMALSTMYQQNVPRYRTLLELVADVNLGILEDDPLLHQQLVNTDELSRLNLERHGAVRVGTVGELAILGQIFAMMGMYPVGYYDQAEEGIPVHSTVFRPVDDAALSRNPLRMFTSLLCLEHIRDPGLRHRAADILAHRDIFTTRCRQLIGIHQQQGGLTRDQAREFISESVKSFHGQEGPEAVAYGALNAQQRLIADVVCVQGCLIRHLTPRTLDIDRVQALMPGYGITPQSVIDGPPRREHPILLRQTRSGTMTQFPPGDQQYGESWTAGFGDVEQRGMALTPKGLALYNAARNRAGEARDNLSHQLRLQQAFAAFPDDEQQLRQQGLAYFRYRLTPQGDSHRSGIHQGDDPQLLIERGWVTARPIVYEDFLTPVGSPETSSGAGDHCHTRREWFENALGCPIYDPFILYQQAEERSKRRCGIL